MLRMNELQPNQIYKHDSGKMFARLLRWQGDSESGGAVTIEIAGQQTTVGLAYFLRKYNIISIQELANDAYQNQGQ